MRAVFLLLWCCSSLLRKNRASVRISCRRRKTPDFRPPGVAAALGAVTFSLSGHPVLRQAPLSTPLCIEVNGVEEFSEHGGGTVLCAKCIRDSGQRSPPSFTETSLACTTEKLSGRKGFS